MTKVADLIIVAYIKFVVCGQCPTWW